MLNQISNYSPELKAREIKDQNQTKNQTLGFWLVQNPVMILDARPSAYQKRSLCKVSRIFTF
jgi:hypothetical protein